MYWNPNITRAFAHSLFIESRHCLCWHQGTRISHSENWDMCSESQCWIFGFLFVQQINRTLDVENGVDVKSIQSYRNRGLECVFRHLDSNDLQSMRCMFTMFVVVWRTEYECFRRISVGSINFRQLPKMCCSCR